MHEWHPRQRGEARVHGTNTPANMADVGDLESIVGGLAEAVLAAIAYAILRWVRPG